MPSNDERYLSAVIAGDTTNLPAPISRRDHYLANIAGMEGVEVPEPIAREDYYYKQIIDNGGTGGGGITPTGTIEIEANGTYDVTQYASAEVDIPEPKPIEEKDINFYDFDGTLLYSYTLVEIAALDTLPAGPVHDDLPIAFSEWSYSLNGLKKLGRRMDVGALYSATGDAAGKITIYVTVTASRRTITLRFQGSGTVNWGDGTTETILGGTAQYTHTYAADGNYVIKTNCYIIGTVGDTTSQIVPGILDTQRDPLTDATQGTSFDMVIVSRSIGAHAFVRAQIRNAILCKGAYISGYMFANIGFSGKCMIIPPCHNNTVYAYSFRTTYTMDKLILPEGLTAIMPYAFAYIEGLRQLYLPDTIETLGVYWMGSAWQMKDIIIPKSVTSLGGNAFYASGIKTIRMLGTTPPTLSGALCSDNQAAELIIYVPADALEDYKTATNWSQYADIMVGY